MGWEKFKWGEMSISDCLCVICNKYDKFENIMVYKGKYDICYNCMISYNEGRIVEIMEWKDKWFI